jgi:hypothetical protein
MTECSFDIAELKTQLLAWEQMYNTMKLRQALAYLTPLEFLKGTETIIQEYKEGGYVPMII